MTVKQLTLICTAHGLLLTFVITEWSEDVAYAEKVTEQADVLFPLEQVAIIKPLLSNFWSLKQLNFF